MLEGYFTYKLFNIYYRTAGSGTPLVLLHGFGEDGSIWHHQVEALQIDALIITPDFPGSGKSILHPADFTTENTQLLESVEFYADAIAALLHHLNITHCTMLGHSMGG